MVKVTAETVEEVLEGEVLQHVDSSLEFDVEAPSQFENEAEAVLWNVLMFMADHSEMSEEEILRSLLADLEENDWEAPYRCTGQHEELEE